MTKAYAALDLKQLLFGSNAVSTVNTPTDFISILLPNIFIISGIILFFYLIFGGFTIIASSGNPEGVQQGQKVIFNAIIGFVVIFTSYWIIQIIEVVTGLNIFNANL